MRRGANAQAIASTPGNFLIAAIAICAIFFRIWKLGNIPGVNGDEACAAFSVKTPATVVTTRE